MTRKQLMTTGVIIGLAGFMMLWFGVNPWAAMGAFLFVAGNNIEQASRP